jgi:GT2 family glycosyltransferase
VASSNSGAIYQYAALGKKPFIFVPIFIFSKVELNNMATQTELKQRIYIIIPVHNRKETTLTCLHRLHRNGDLGRYHVVVVDDGSTDGTAEAIQSSYPDVVILFGDGDLWWTGAMAIGMQYAYDQGAEYFIWLNDDCFPEKGTLLKLVDFLQAHPHTIAAPACYPPGSSSPTVSGFRGRRSLRARPGEKISVDGLSGWCVGIPAEVFQKIGPPDPTRFPHYCGDDTYILRATRVGLKAFILGDLKIHLCGVPYHGRDFHSYVRAKKNPIQTFQNLFWNKKSPYRIPTLFFYQVERYGLAAGLCLFLVKAVNWFGKWFYAQSEALFQLKT